MGPPGSHMALVLQKHADTGSEQQHSWHEPRHMWKQCCGKAVLGGWLASTEHVSHGGGTRASHKACTTWLADWNREPAEQRLANVGSTTLELPRSCCMFCPVLAKRPLNGHAELLP